MATETIGGPHRILISDPVDEACIEVFRRAGCEVEYLPGLSPEKLLGSIDRFDALIVRSQTRVTAAVIDAGTELKIVGRAGAGVDNIDVTAATRRGIIVMNTPGGNTIATAEHTMALMLAMARNVPQAHESVRAGKWERSAFTGTELQGKVLGILGLGKVGFEVALRCAGFGMKVIAFDPVQSPDVAEKAGVALVGLDELLPAADIISVHVPLMAETKGLLNGERLARCKDGVRVVNCARGGIVDERALLAALESGKVAAAALDVFETEPPKDSPLLRHPRVVVTPHLGASTEEAQEKVAIQIAHQVVAVLGGGAAEGAVNAGLIRLAMRKDIRPYVALAECIGKIIQQINSGPITSMEVTHAGALPVDALTVLSASALKGMLSAVLSEPVNLVNAPMIARERGMTVKVHHAGGAENNREGIEIEYRTASAKRRITGAVFGEEDFRITGIDGFHVEIRPEGHLLLYSNPDRPGMLAKVSQVLADAEINIAGLSLGRSGAGKEALTILSTDTPIGEEVRRKVSGIPGVNAVHVVTL